jgi:hypothetical protein
MFNINIQLMKFNIKVFIDNYITKYRKKKINIFRFLNNKKKFGNINNNMARQQYTSNQYGKKIDEDNLLNDLL